MSRAGETDLVCRTEDCPENGKIVTVPTVYRGLGFSELVDDNDLICPACERHRDPA